MRRNPTAEELREAGLRAARGEKLQPDTSEFRRLAGIEPADVQKAGAGGGIFGAMAQARHYEERQARVRSEDQTRKVLESSVEYLTQLLHTLNIRNVRVEIRVTSEDGDEVVVVSEDTMKAA